ncbi:MAG: 2-phosphosulfolactate phosphatase [Chitinophagia bacterium]|nr:2-phosphosulfolactate phosphatase [Chitinophagia bacterium]
MSSGKPSLHTCLSPALLHLYDLRGCLVVIIDVLRATSTIATAIHNGASAVLPVATVPRCIELGQELGGITAGERDGKVAEGLSYGNSPFEYPESFIGGRLLVLTTTNGTKLLHMALDNGAQEIVTGAFVNLSSVCDHLVERNMPVVLGCAAWKDRVNMEDTLFAGAVIDRIGRHFHLNCDSSHFALNLYRQAEPDLFGFMQENQASHYNRLMGFGLEKDIRYCLSTDKANILPIFRNDRLVKA